MPLEELKLNAFSGDIYESVDGWLENTEMHFNLYKRAADEKAPDGVMTLTGCAAV